MAFTFVIETGLALSDANSFTSVEFADDYVDTNIHISADWLALEEGTKQRLLVRASLYLSRMILWEGTRIDEDSGLPWPRAGVYNIDGFLVDEDVIPIELQQATVELAVHFMSGDLASTASTTSALEEIVVDVIELKYADPVDPEIVPNFVLALIDGLGVLRPKPGRSNFKKIRRT